MNIKFLSGIRIKKFKFNFNFKTLKIRTRILGLFLVIITTAITIVTGVTYTIGKTNLEDMITNQLNNSVRSIANQISLLTSAYSSKEFSGKLNYVLTSELASYKQAGYDTNIFLLKSDGSVVDRTNVNNETNKKSEFPDSFIKLALKQKKGNIETHLNGKSVTLAYEYIIEKDWIYAVAVTKASYLKLLYTLQIASIITGVICICIAFILSLLGTRGIVDTISKLSKTVTAAGDGNLSTRSNATHGGPEMVNLSKSLNLMISNIQSFLREISASIEELNTSSMELNQIAKKTDDSTSYVYGLTQKMSEDSEEQNNFVVQMADSANQLIITIEKITQKVNHTAGLSELMISSVSEGMKSIGELNRFMIEIEKVSDKTVDFIHVLNKRSNEINKIAGAIKNISDQTKLLSFNASIEASKAGVYGQGFSVVAHEMQKLAYSSAQSAIEVEGIIKDIRINTDAILKIADHGRVVSHEGARMANTTDKAFNEILDKVSETHQNVKDISENAEIISLNIKLFEINSEKIVNTINLMTASSQEVAVEVEKHHSMSNDVTINAGNVLKVASKLGQLKSSFTAE